jgi:transposase
LLAELLNLFLRERFRQQSSSLAIRSVLQERPNEFLQELNIFVCDGFLAQNLLRLKEHFRCALVVADERLDPFFSQKRDE